MTLRKKYNLALQLEVSSRFLLAWLPVLCLALYLKYVIVEHDGFRLLARQIGKVNSPDLEWWESLSFFERDILQGFLLFPLSVIVLSYLCRGSRLWPVLLSAVNILLAALLFIQLQSYYLIGSFTSYAKLLMAKNYVAAQRSELFTYVPAAVMIKFLIVLVVSSSVLWWGVTQYRKRRLRCLRPRVGAICFALVLTAAASVLLVLRVLAANTPETAFHDSIAAQAISAWVGGDQIISGKYDHLSLAELYQQQREMTKSVAGSPDARFWGRALGYDVILFILESIPAEVLDVDGDLSDLPALNSLRRDAITAPHHYTTCSYTNRAIFSILTSLYPVAGRNNYLQNPPGRYEGPSLMSSLAGAGYATSVYSGDPLSFENDEYLYRELGIQRFVYGSQRVKGHNDSEPWQETAKKDYAALKLLKHDIAAFAAANQRYAALYVPLISHGPWPDISAEENVSEVNKRGRNLLRLQDGWLGEIAEHLTALGTLNRTLIVFAADHGLRTKKDDPAFSGSRLEKKSFHVPLLIFAPGIGADQASIPYLSSHIDIAPTLLDLLGQPRQREFEQGLPLWDKRIAERTTFFLGRHYFGIDGYHRSGSFAMWNIALRMAEESAAFEFGGRGAALPPAPRYAEISGAIQDIVAVQQLVLARFASRRSL